MRRKRHKWVLSLTVPLSEKEAQAAHDPDGADVPITPDRVAASFVFCKVCHEPHAAAVGSFCAGEAGAPLPIVS